MSFILPFEYESCDKLRLCNDVNLYKYLRPTHDI